MEYRFFLFSLIFIGLLVSCETDTTIDPRLKGTYICKLSGSSLSHTEEIRFSGNKFKTKDIFTEVGKPESKFEFDYKIKSVRFSKEGGIFYAISSYLGNEAFEDASKRKTYFYVFDGNNLLMEEGDSGEKYYIKL